jgi:hypothetical protein
MHAHHLKLARMRGLKAGDEAQALHEGGWWQVST